MSHGGLHILRSGGDAPGARERADATPPVTVLLVEDDAAIAEALEDMLRDEGLEVARAANGREALALLRRGLRPSSILLDLMMPVMDGWDFRQEQLADPALKDIPVVVVSAAGFSPETIRAQLGDVHLLPKPVPCRALFEILDQVRAPTSSAA
jgi:CheY-like chemotaxis protein